MAPMLPTRLPAHKLRAVAVKAQVDPRTVRRVLAGRPTREICAERVRGAISDLGLGESSPESSESSPEGSR